MKRSLSTSLTLLSLSLVGCSVESTSSTSAQPTPVTEVVPGGFSPLTPTDAGAVEAAKVITSKIGDGWTLEKIVSARSQVVAGTNFALTLDLKKGPDQKRASAAVWKKLDGTLEVTRWTWLSD